MSDKKTKKPVRAAKTKTVDDDFSLEPIKRLLKEGSGLHPSTKGAVSVRLFLHQYLKEIAKFTKMLADEARVKTITEKMIARYVAYHGHGRFNVLVVEKHKKGERQLPKAVVVREFKRQIGGEMNVTKEAKAALVYLCEEKIKRIGAIAADYASVCKAKTAKDVYIGKAIEQLQHSC